MNILGQKAVYKLNRSPLAWIFLVVAGFMLHFAVEEPLKAAAILAGAILIDIAVDLMFTRAEQKAGEID